MNDEMTEEREHAQRLHAGSVHCLSAVGYWTDGLPATDQFCLVTLDVDRGPHVLSSLSLSILRRYRRDDTLQIELRETRRDDS